MVELINAFGHLDPNSQCSLLAMVAVVVWGITEFVKILKNNY